MHFQETYTTALKRADVRSLVSIEWVTDLTNKENLVLELCRKADQNPSFVGVEPFTGIELPSSIICSLNNMLKISPVDAALISTTPEQHRAYATWALENGLDVLIDKPVTSRQNAAHDVKQALGILEDWEALDKLSNRMRRVVMINSHRRFHPAYWIVGELLGEVSRQYGFGVTSLTSFNSDGQWRMPNELLETDYHGFKDGNGVLSHFGYHYLDLANIWYRKGTPPERLADTAAISSSFSLAQNYARQVTAKDACRVLALKGEPAPKPDNDRTIDALKSYGEIDSYSSIEMWHDDIFTGHITLQMVHSGFSQRAWTKPAQNLYKENGRVRWENHLIQQGPLHAIEVRSFQAVQPSHFEPEEGLPRWELGGSDHLEINVFRNRLIGGKALETINVRDLLSEIPPKDVVHEDVKAKTFQLFASVVARRVGIADSVNESREWAGYVEKMLSGPAHDLSLLSTHQPTVALMAGMYGSFAQRCESQSRSERIRVGLIW